MRRGKAIGDQYEKINRDRFHVTVAGDNYTRQELEFMLAMETYRLRTGHMFPTCCEQLAVARSLGYRLVAEPGPLPTFCERPKE